VAYCTLCALPQVPRTAAHDDSSTANSHGSSSRSSSSSSSSAAASGTTGKCSTSNTDTSNNSVALTRWQLAQLLTALLQQARATKAAAAAVRLQRHTAVEIALASDMAHRWTGRRHSSTSNADKGDIANTDTAAARQSNHSSGAPSTTEQQVSANLTLVTCDKATFCIPYYMTALRLC
jgi:hypothetical protein